MFFRASVFLAIIVSLQACQHLPAISKTHRFKSVVQNLYVVDGMLDREIYLSPATRNHQLTPEFIKLLATVKDDNTGADFYRLTDANNGNELLISSVSTSDVALQYTSEMTEKRVENPDKASRVDEDDIDSPLGLLFAIASDLADEEYRTTRLYKNCTKAVISADLEVSIGNRTFKENGQSSAINCLLDSYDKNAKAEVPVYDKQKLAESAKKKAIKNFVKKLSPRKLSKNIAFVTYNKNSEDILKRSSKNNYYTEEKKQFNSMQSYLVIKEAANIVKSDWQRACDLYLTDFIEDNNDAYALINDAILFNVASCNILQANFSEALVYLNMLSSRPFSNEFNPHLRRHIKYAESNAKMTTSLFYVTEIK